MVKKNCYTLDEIRAAVALKAHWRHQFALGDRREWQSAEADARAEKEGQRLSGRLYALCGRDRAQALLDVLSEGL